MSDQKRGGMPTGIPYIIGNEAAERFSYYGMKAILFTFMTKYMLDSTGEPDYMSDTDAQYWYHIFVMFVYLLPVLGGLLSDIFWGKYRTIIVLSIVYCAGHVALAFNETRIGLLLGLSLIAIGAGGIKPCVSAHVGDQFDKSNNHLLERVFSYFYIAINVGAAVSQILTPILLETEGIGPRWAFGIPGALMIIATFLFWYGRKDFVSVPAVGWEKYKKEVFTADNFKIILKLCSVYVFISVFWSLFDQHGSSWIAMAEHDLVIKKVSLLGFDINLLAAQIQASNPVMVLVLVPLFTFIFYPLMQKHINLTPLVKVSIGMFLAVIPFTIIALMQEQVDAGHQVSILWQFLAFFVLTIAEVMVSITCLEYSYKQAPVVMKSLIMGIYLLSIFLGNFIAAGVNGVISNADGTSKLEGASYFWFFTILMIVTACLFLFRVRSYKEE